MGGAARGPRVGFEGLAEDTKLPSHPIRADPHLKAQVKGYNECLVRWRRC